MNGFTPQKSSVKKSCWINQSKYLEDFLLVFKRAALPRQQFWSWIPGRVFVIPANITAKYFKQISKQQNSVLKIKDTDPSAHHLGTQTGIFSNPCQHTPVKQNTVAALGERVQLGQTSCREGSCLSEHSTAGSMSRPNLQQGRFTF